MSEKKFDKLVFFLPNTFTALNMGCGFVAIMYSMQIMQSGNGRYIDRKVAVDFKRNPASS